MKAIVNVLAVYYRRLFLKFGTFQPLIHASFVTYCILLLVCGALNILVPSFGLRNSYATGTNSNSNGYYRWGGTQAVLSEPEMGRCVSKGLLESDSSGVNSDPILSRVKAEFSCGCNLPQVYESGEVPNNISVIAENIKADRSIQEVIICDDSSNDELLVQWSDFLRGLRHFVIRTNKVSRIRCYNRAMRMTSSEYLVLMTDNYLPTLPTIDPSEDSSESSSPDRWIAQALELFDADPKLGMLSGAIGQLWDQESSTSLSGRENGYIFGEQNPYKKDSLYIRRIPFLSKRTLKPFMYVECGWVGPMIIRTRSNMMVGGLDVALGGDTNSGNWEDCALSYSAWASGWRVGLFDADFQNINGNKKHNSPPRNAHTKVPAVLEERFDRTAVRKKVLDLNDITLTGRYDNNDTVHNVYN